MIAENLEKIRGRVAEICSRCGRRPDEVGIIAVSKTFPESMIREAAGAGQTAFGENYAQEFRRKADGLNDLRLEWHFIGHLQSNKAKLVAGDVSLIHSVDSLSLASELQKRAHAIDRTIGILVEVHTTDEASKTGVPVSKIDEFVRQLAGYDRLKVRGLMTMGPFADDPERSRPCFRELRSIRDRLRQEGPPGASWNELSMGMSADFPVAIEEGATLIRVGTAIFGRRTPPARGTP